MTTSGDRRGPAATSPAGVKGLFVAEIVRALQAGEVDLAVHSAKDLPAADDEGVVVAAVPPRADPSDLLVTRDPTLRGGAIVGTSSLRRRAQLLALRPELRLVEIRGNVDRRLRKLEDGEVDGVVLAAAGIARLGATPPSSEVLPIVPAPGQGCLAVQARADDQATREAVAWLDDPDSRLAFEAERSVMARRGGGGARPPRAPPPTGCRCESRPRRRGNGPGGTPPPASPSAQPAAGRTAREPAPRWPCTTSRHMPHAGRRQGSRWPRAPGGG